MSEATLPASATLAAPAAVQRSRRATVALHTLRIALGLFFAIASASPKLTAHVSATEPFDKIGFGDWFMYAIGGLELAGGIALLIPVLSGVASLAFVGLMVGAFSFSLAFLGGEFWYTPLILIVPLLLIARAQRDQTVRLLKAVQRRV
ncbi:DoxX family protein [Streptomyces sp. TRM66268-LWL]|uniref:DoxX family protein n=1 Tax=Streptomyces polyasparticus TaxID=2767826 RepID=A0ABR7SA79_9ACTN|nr:DoxX family protein [Streptomyces polyasparticus]MBC9712054.1 DoxX family protein [Streptomyces polyasparticus]